MKTVLFTGHHGFSNRGCEALVRSSVELLSGTFGPLRFLVPSLNCDLDRLQWPEAESLGVEWIPAYQPWFARYWVNLQHLPHSPLQHLVWPFRLPAHWQQAVSTCDLVLCTGGDNYSLDYKTPSLVMACDQLAVKLNKPVVLWGASVGPFDSAPTTAEKVRQLFAQFQQLTVRESISLQYLKQKLDFEQVQLIPDPAFSLESSPWDLTHLNLSAKDRWVGVNASALFARYTDAPNQFPSQLAELINYLSENNWGIVLVPHVSPLDREGGDYAFLKQVLGLCSTSTQKNIRLLPDGLNAAQLKYVIAQLDFFIGARTHATLAALSSCIPTLSLAYSVKAVGINKDLMGDDRLILHAKSCTAAGMIEAFERIVDQKPFIVERLQAMIPVYQQRLSTAVQQLKPWLDVSAR